MVDGPRSSDACNTQFHEIGIRTRDFGDSGKALEPSGKHRLQKLQVTSEKTYISLYTNVRFKAIPGMFCKSLK